MRFICADVFGLILHLGAKSSQHIFTVVLAVQQGYERARDEVWFRNSQPCATKSRCPMNYLVGRNGSR